jgi:hypothetical protein
LFSQQVQNNIPVTYLVFPQEGHWIQKPQDNIAWAAICEVFLAVHIQGAQAQSIGDDLWNADVEIRHDGGLAIQTTTTTIAPTTR